MFCLPPHPSHLLQPLDLSLLVHKMGWEEACATFSLIMLMVVNQCSFAKVFNVTWHFSTTPKVIRGRFKRASFFPYDPASMFGCSKPVPTVIRQVTHTSVSDATVSLPSTEATTTSPVSIPTVTAVPAPPELVLHLCAKPSTGRSLAHNNAKSTSLAF